MVWRLLHGNYGFTELNFKNHSAWGTSRSGTNHFSHIRILHNFRSALQTPGFLWPRPGALTAPLSSPAVLPISLPERSITAGWFRAVRHLAARFNSHLTEQITWNHAADSPLAEPLIWVITNLMIFPKPVKIWYLWHWCHIVNSGWHWPTSSKISRKKQGRAYSFHKNVLV